MRTPHRYLIVLATFLSALCLLQAPGRVYAQFPGMTPEVAGNVPAIETSSVTPGVAGNVAAIAAAPNALAHIPVKEVTVFKDGYALIKHEGAMPVDAQGNVLVDYLPSPVLGTFWSYSADPAAKLVSVVAGQSSTAGERRVANIRELLEANIGAEAIIHEAGVQYTAVILGDAAQAGEQPMQGLFSSREILRPKDDLLALKTGEDVHLAEFSHIEEVEFKKPPKTSVSTEEKHTLFTLHLDWGEKTPAKTAAVGMCYLQQGIRWVPSYRVSIDGHGKAEVTLQATILNELTDLEHATVNLVVGVPSFEFKDTADPMDIPHSMAQLSSYFSTMNSNNNGYNNNNNNSNAIMSQVPSLIKAPPLTDYTPGNLAGTKNEDLFVYTIKDITLKMGERMQVSVAEFSIPYKDLYTLDIPAVPPQDVVREMNDNQRSQVAQLVNAPKAMHQIRLQNESRYPLTTAPALIFRGGQVIAQGLMSYAPPGSASDLPLTTAINLGVRKSEKEMKRNLEALTLENQKYTRIDLSGAITLTNGSSETVEVQIIRHFVGNADQIDHSGKLSMDNVESEDELQTTNYPDWWGQYGWPDWWNRLNGLGRATWSVTLAPGKNVDLGYSWYYYWR